MIDFSADPLQVAPRLLGAVIATDVAIRLTEVEAYRGSEDPGSHAFSGPTKRNASMFGPPGHLYCYLSYGIHWNANIVCWPEDRAGGVLLRAGEVIAGHELARERRAKARTDRDLARGPGRLGQALGLNGSWDGATIGESITLSAGWEPQEICTGPRVGVSGPGGSEEYPFRFWIANDRYVSPYRKGKL
ncbi:MAG: DNA-3-methyladenine glycosylase [Flaviflexus sp.]|nr:DNA-3-methyladenine glycosylase [Flaviflexus sp.]